MMTSYGAGCSWSQRSWQTSGSHGSQPRARREPSGSQSRPLRQVSAVAARHRGALTDPTDLRTQTLRCQKDEHPTVEDRTSFKGNALPLDKPAQAISRAPPFANMGNRYCYRGSSLASMLTGSSIAFRHLIIKAGATSALNPSLERAVCQTRR